MKIAHFPATFFPNIGGAEIVVHNVAEQQTLLGHDVFVIVPSVAINYVKEKKLSIKHAEL